MTSRAYQVARRQLLRQGREELAVSDVRQASKKGRGAAAQMVKAIAAQRQIHRAARCLGTETGDREIICLFLVTNSLHSNFYEDWQGLK